MNYDERLIDDGAVRLFLAQEDVLHPIEEILAYGRRTLGIGEPLTHDGDCTKQPYTCRLCVREEYQRMMRAALDAIAASGTHQVIDLSTHWGAPLEATRKMEVAMAIATYEEAWPAAREAYFAEQAKEKS